MELMRWNVPPRQNAGLLESTWAGIFQVGAVRISTRWARERGAAASRHTNTQW